VVEIRLCADFCDADSAPVLPFNHPDRGPTPKAGKSPALQHAGLAESILIPGQEEEHRHHSYPGNYLMPGLGGGSRHPLPDLPQETEHQDEEHHEEDASDSSLLCGSSVSGTTSGKPNLVGNAASDDLIPFCVTSPGTMSISTCGGADWDTVLRIYDTVPGTQLAENDDGRQSWPGCLRTGPSL